MDSMTYLILTLFWSGRSWSFNVYIGYVAILYRNELFFTNYENGNQKKTSLKPMLCNNEVEVCR